MLFEVLHVQFRQDVHSGKQCNCSIALQQAHMLVQLKRRRWQLQEVHEAPNDRHFHTKMFSSPSKHLNFPSVRLCCKKKGIIVGLTTDAGGVVVASVVHIY
jgi:hypothetical protein